jgi:hypothetical protein
VEGKAMTGNKECAQTSKNRFERKEKGDCTVPATRLRSATAEYNQLKPARESVKSNVEKQKNYEYFLEEV